MQVKKSLVGYLPGANILKAPIPCTAKQPRGVKRKPRSGSCRVLQEQRSSQQRRGLGIKRSQELRCDPCPVLLVVLLFPLARCDPTAWIPVGRMVPICCDEALAQPVQLGVPSGLGATCTFILRTQRFASAGCNNTSCFSQLEASTCLALHPSMLVLLHLGRSPTLVCTNLALPRDQIPCLHQRQRHTGLDLLFAHAVAADGARFHCSRRGRVVPAPPGLIGLTVHYR